MYKEYKISKKYCLDKVVDYLSSIRITEILKGVVYIRENYT